MAPNTMKSLTDCTRVRSSGRWHSSTRVDAPMKLKFRSEEHTSDLQSLMRISYAVFCLKKDKCLEHAVCATTGQSEQNENRSHTQANKLLAPQTTHVDTRHTHPCTT